ncbi:MAG: TolC family protein [Dyella sp.]
MFLRLAWMGCALMLLVACASVTTPPLDPPLPIAWRNAPALAPGAAAADLHGWWRSFDDDELDALIDRALRNNLTVAEALEHLRAAREAQHHSQDRFLPNLHARTDDAIDPDASASFFIAGFDATWELGLFGARQGARQMGEGELATSAALLQAARVSLVAEVTRQWILLRTAQAQESLLQQVLDGQQQRLAIVRQRLQLQLASAQDVASAQVALAQAQAALSEPRQAINASVQQLAMLLGQPTPDPQWLNGGAQPHLGDWQLASAPADLLRTRPEIASAEAEVLRAAGQMNLSRAQMYPNLALGAALQYSTDITSYRRTRTRAIFSSGPIIDIPLFDWGNRVSAAHASAHQLKAAVYAYRQAVLQGVSEVETAMGDLQQLYLREQALTLASQASQQAELAVRTRVALRLDSPLQLQQSQLEDRQSQLELVAARAARSLAYVSLYKALGGAPLDGPHTPDEHASARGAR